MTDVGLHSSDGGLPLFFREESGVAAAGSYVRIGAVKYPIPVDETISVRPFFIAYSAFICTGYNGLIFPTFHEQVPLYTEAAGAQAGLFESEIITVRNGSVFETAKVVYSSWLYDDAAKAEIVFNPPLANLHALAVGSTAVSRFVIRFSASKQDEVYGDVIVKKEDQSRVVVDLVPYFPGWAKESRAMRYVIELKDDGANVQAGMKGADAK